MTKRVLSMLMALIMALSLCVPAFAADEPVSADEPAAEVEAPAAEAEETEAEAEPAEEAADAPEAAAVDEPETVAVDEPLLVALGIVNKDAHYALKKAVEDAAAIEAKIKAGGVYLDGGKMDQNPIALPDLAKYAEDPVENDPFKDELVADGTNKTFEEVYAEAKDMLEAIDGKPVDYPVTSTSVEAKATELGTWSATNVTDKVDSTNMTTAGLQHFLWNTDKSDSPAVLTYKSESVTIPAIKLDGTGYDLSDDPFWAQAYSADYLAKLQAAIDAVNAYVTKGTKVTYSDYKAVVYAILDALVLEQAAGKPGEAEKTSAEAALAKAEAILKDEQKGDKYLFADTISAKKTALEGLMEKSDGFIPFKYDKTRYEVVAAIKALEDAMVETPANPTVKIKEITGTIGEATAKVTLTATKFNEVAGEQMKLDGHTYSITWKITDKAGNTKWIAGKTDEYANEGTTDADPTDAGVLELSYKAASETVVHAQWAAGTNQDAGLWVAKDVEVYNTGDGSSSNDNFAEGDTLTVYIYEVKDSNKLYKLVDSKSFTFEEVEAPDPEKPDATIESVTYAFTAGSTDIDKFNKTSDKLIGSSRYNPDGKWGTLATGTTITVTPEEAIEVGADQFSFRVVAKVGGKAFYGEATHGANPSSFTLTVADNALNDLLKAGENGTIELQCSKYEVSDDDLAFDVIDTAKLTVKSITEWSHAEALGDVVAAANALIETDYDLTDEAKNQHLGEATVALTLAHIKAIAGELNALITNASLADSATNENNAVAKLKELCKWCGYLTPLAASTTEFKALWKDANDIITKDFTKKPEGTGTYTFDSLGKLSDLVPGKYTTNGWADGKLLSEVEAAIAEIQAAIDGLVELGEVDKTDLENSIKAAQEKLADKDQYTEESVKALENALATAESVLAMENPTQAALTNAAENLNKAVAGLVKKVDADDLAAAIEAAEAAIADPSKYTEDSVKAVEDAITAAKALGDDATTEEIANAIEALESAVKGLTEAATEPEIPEAPEGGKGWAQAEDGTYYYYEDGELVVNKWVKSKNLWYHMGADGTMDTGFIHIVDDWGDGWYYLEESNDKGTQGRMRTGWWEVNDELTGQWGWFETRSNGHQGMCTYTSAQGDYKDYKPVK